ncbi:MAG TPA: hypothetical protein VFI20_07890, partial [Terracidiphilus sp.]|nr:hypothetical protein [Terracidiphilus sp.]
HAGTAEAGNRMPDYIYLLENRLSADQQQALRQLREVASDAGVLLFLVGDAVRDLTSGFAVRDIEVAVQGNALKLAKAVEKRGGKVWGEDETFRTLFLCFPGSVRIDLTSTHSREYPKPGRPIYHPASVQEDLRRRDFTVNAMAISLNDGSFGLLMDPLNGVADIEARTLRLVSPYGFLEQPSLLVRAIRYRTRLGWDLDPRTQSRYADARAEGVIDQIHPHARNFELEQIGHESEALKVLQALEAEGLMKHLFPAWTSARADARKLEALHDLAVELHLQGVNPDMSAAQMQLLTAKMPPRDISQLKRSLPRTGFVQQWNSLDSAAAKFSKVLLSKEHQTPSASFKLFMSNDPESILWLGFTSTNPAVKERYAHFLKDWPEARQRIPHALMQEMRITPGLANYAEIVHRVFLELIDERLNTPEEARAFLEPYSPPAPPPQVTLKRSRARRSAEARVKERSFEDEEEEELGGDREESDLDDIGSDDDEIDLGDESETDEESDAEKEEAPAAVKPVVAKSGRKKKATEESPSAAAQGGHPVKKAPAKPAPEMPAKTAAPQKEKAKAPATPVSKSKPQASKVPAKKTASKPVPKPAPKAAAKPAPRSAGKPAPKNGVKARPRPKPKAGAKPKPSAKHASAGAKAKTKHVAAKAGKPHKQTSKKAASRPARKR